MQDQTSMSSRRSFGWAAAFVALLTLGVALEIRDLFAWVGVRIPRLPFPWGGAVLDNLLAVALIVAVAAWLGRRAGPLWRGLGFTWAGWAGPALTLLATVPFWVGLALQAKVATDLSVVELVLLDLVFPLAEEIVFRGFGFVFVRQRLRWPWPAAVLVQTIAFGGVHWLSAGADGGVALEIFAVTAAGALLFAWLDAMDGYTIWSGWVFHASLNAGWNVFAVSDTAASDSIWHVLRFVSALLAALFLWWLQHRRAAALSGNDRGH